MSTVLFVLAIVLIATGATCTLLLYTAHWRFHRARTDAELAAISRQLIVLTVIGLASTFTAFVIGLSQGTNAP